MTNEIDDFVAAVGGVEPNVDESHTIFRGVFKRRNYFRINGSWCIVKISRTSKPFWGIGKRYIDLFSELESFFVVLLISSSEGWVFSKQEVLAFIQSGRWNLREKDQNYKINPPLPDRNSFFSPEGCLRVMDRSANRSLPPSRPRLGATILSLYDFAIPHRGARAGTCSGRRRRPW